MSYIYSLALVKLLDDNPKLIHISYELSSFGFFERFTIKDVCYCAIMESIKRCQVGRFYSLEYDNYICYSYLTPEKIAVSCIAGNEYPLRVINKFFLDTLQIYTNNSNNESTLKSDMDKLLQSYQDITKIDKILLIKTELDETKKICQDTMEKLLIRGDELNDLIKRTEYLNEGSKSFVIETRKLNSCCILF